MKKGSFESLIDTAKSRSQTLRREAIRRARRFASSETEYVLGGKTEAGMDCSGLITLCYPLLPDGASNQCQRLRRWLYHGNELHLSEPGDIVFLGELTLGMAISHVALVSDVSATALSVIHSSERVGYVIVDSMEMHQERFRERYHVHAIGKMDPFLFGNCLDEEVSLRVKERNGSIITIAVE